MATPLAGLRGGPRFGVLGIEFGVSTGTKTGTVSSGSFAKVIIIPLAKVVTTNVSMSARTRVAPIYVAVVRLRSNAKVSPVAVKVKPVTVNLSSKTTVTPVATKGKLATVNLSSKATATPVATNTKLATANLSSKVTVTPVATKIRIAVTSLSSKVVLTPVCFKAGLIKTAELSSKTTITPVAVVTKFATAYLKGSTTVNPNGIGPAPRCECPSWHVNPTLVYGWIINPIECPSNQADLPFTLPVFRLYELSAVVSSGGYNHADGITCTTSGGREADLPYTLPIFRMHAISNLIASRGYYRDDSTSCTTTRDGTLSKQFTRKGCL